MNKIIKNSIIGVVLIGGIAGAGITSSSITKENITKEYNEKIINQQAELAVLWEQDSAEAKALRVQAYNIAKENIDQLTEENKMPKNPAVIMDIDETVLDNIPAGAYQITSNHGYNDEDFKEWTKSTKCNEIQGAVDFIQYAQKNGVKVFLISNRTEEEKAATMKNLKDLGVNIDENHVILKDKTSNKQERFNSVTTDHTVIMYIGDNASDFGGAYYKKSNEERSQLVMANKDEFGVKYIMLPNPTYGDFDGALINYDFSKSTDQKIADRNNALKPFK